MPKIWVEVDDSRVLRKLDRLAAGPDAESIFQFETALVVRMIKTQAMVHVDTGNLKRSGKARSVATPLSWTGSITYGDMVPVGENTVDYAWYEQRRDGHHDFMRGIEGEGDSKDYINVIVDYLKREG